MWVPPARRDEAYLALALLSLRGPGMVNILGASMHDACSPDNTCSRSNPHRLNLQEAPLTSAPGVSREDEPRYLFDCTFSALPRRCSEVGPPDSMCVPTDSDQTRE